MTKHFFILLLLYTILFGSCYKKRYIASQKDKAQVQKKYDSIAVENSKKEALNKILNSRTDSLFKANSEMERLANDFRLKYVQFPSGAIFTPDSVIAKSKQFESAAFTAPANFLINPVQISMWGNDYNGDCVTAEEAFAKACNNPEIFITENEVVSWASENGFLNGALLPSVLQNMTELGFRSNGNTYNDGNYFNVNFRNRQILQNAIYSGPVKIGLTSTQLYQAWTNFYRGWFAVNFQSEPITDKNSHCVSLCGYGTLSWLAQQFNRPLPIGVNGQAVGYAIFTWGSIGIIDEQSLLKITHEAWLRSPTTVGKNSISSFVLKAMGGETSKQIYLSHANFDLDLLPTFPGGFGEMWICHNLGGGRVKLQARGAENGLYLSHAHKTLELRPTYDGGTGEEWQMHDMGNGQFALEALGGEKGLHLSHGYGNLSLRKNRETGEAWLNMGQH